jgi:hypothetical protein
MSGQRAQAALADIFNSSCVDHPSFLRPIIPIGTLLQGLDGETSTTVIPSTLSSHVFRLASLAPFRIIQPHLQPRFRVPVKPVSSSVYSLDGFE